MQLTHSAMACMYWSHRRTWQLSVIDAKVNGHTATRILEEEIAPLASTALQMVFFEIVKVVFLAWIWSCRTKLTSDDCAADSLRHFRD